MAWAQRKYATFVSLAAAFAMALPVSPCAAQPRNFAAAPYAALQVPSLAPLLREVAPAVVNIAVRGRVRRENPLYRDPFFRQFFDAPAQQQSDREVEATGSGVIIDAEHGYVITNNHLVENESEIEVSTSDNRRYRASLIGRDENADIAVLQISGAPYLKALRFGDSSRLQVGDFVVAIGNPFGIGQTMTLGIVSALGRHNLGTRSRGTYIQTDASINPGNSGGALIDLNGRLIGINTAILTRGGNNVGIGFAIPSNTAYAAMAQIMQWRSVRGEDGR